MFFGRILTGLVFFMFFISASVYGQPPETTSETANDVQTDRVGGRESANAPMGYTLSACIKRTLKENPKIKAAEFEIKKAESEIGIQRGHFFPTFSLQTYAEQITSINSKGPSDEDYLDQDINVLNFRLSQTLFQGFTIFNSYQKSVLNKALVKARKKQVKMDLILEVQTHFLKLLKTREDMRSLKAAVHRLEVNRKAIKSFYEKQMTPYVAVLQSEVELADARQLLSKAKNEVHTLNVMLNILLGFPPDMPIKYVGHLSSGNYNFNMDLSVCTTCAHKNRPEMEISDISLEMGEKELAIQSGQFSPRITANADYYIRNTWYDNQRTNGIGQTYDPDQENTYWTAMIQLQWDFNLGGRQFYQRGKAVHEIAKLRQNRKSTRDLITAQVQMHYTNLLETRGRIDFSQTALESAREGYERAQKRYQVQVGTIDELLDIQASLTRAEANCNQAVSDYQLGLANLYYAMGQQNFTLTENQMPEDSTITANGNNGDPLNRISDMKQ